MTISVFEKETHPERGGSLLCCETVSPFRSEGAKQINIKNN